MKLEDQVVSLELAKELKELGVKQESLFYWITQENKSFISYGVYHNPEHRHCSSFTVAELGEMIGNGWEDWDIDRNDRGNGEVWWIPEWYDYDSEEEVWMPQKTLMANTEADARAKLLIHLIKEGIIKTK
jgi:hypothetical protein